MFLRVLDDRQRPSLGSSTINNPWELGGVEHGFTHWAFGYFFGDAISWRVSIGYPRASQGIPSITVELASWLEQKNALEKVENV